MIAMRHLAIDGGATMCSPAAWRLRRRACENSWPRRLTPTGSACPRWCERRARRGAADPRSRARRPRAQRAPRGRGHSARRRDQGGRRGRQSFARQGQRRTRSLRRRQVWSSPTARRTAGWSLPGRRPSWHASAECPSSPVAMGTADGVVEVPLAGGYTAHGSRVPADPATLRGVAGETGGRLFASPTLEQLEAVYSDLESRLGSEEEWREVTVAFAAAARSCCSSAERCRPAGSGGFRRERRQGRRLRCGADGARRAVRPRRRRMPQPPGLHPAWPGRGSPSQKEMPPRVPQRVWRMKCPQGSIVGGVDARLTHRAVDMSSAACWAVPSTRASRRRERSSSQARTPAAHRGRPRTGPSSVASPRRAAAASRQPSTRPPP